MKKIVISGLILAPMLASAQELGNVKDLLGAIGELVSMALPILVGLALLGFFWGLTKFIFQQGNEEQKVEAKNIMIWSVVAFFVMVSVWGLVRFIGSALDIDQESTPLEVPTVPGLD